MSRSSMQAAMVSSFSGAAGSSHIWDFNAGIAGSMSPSGHSIRYWSDHMAMVQIPMDELRKMDKLIAEQKRVIRVQEDAMDQAVATIDRVLLIIRGRGTVPE